MNKKELFYKYTDFVTLQNIGAGWIGAIKGYVPWGQIIQEIAVYQVMVWGFHLPIPTVAIAAFLLIKYYTMMVVNFMVGKLAIKIGVYKAQQQYGAKKEHLNPYNLEVIQTLKAICEKIGAKDAFSDL